MKLKLFLLCLVIVLSSCDEDDGMDTININETKFGVIEGQILDGVSKSPLSNVLISTYPPTTSILTDVEGKYKIENVKEDNYDIFLERTGYKDAQASIYVVGNKSNKANIFMFDREYLNHAPNIPELIFPDLNTQNINYRNIEFKWSASDPDNDRLKYNIYLDTNSTNLKLFASNLDKREYLVDSLLKNKTYYIIIESIDTYGLSSKSEIFTFNTNVFAPVDLGNTLIFGLNQASVVSFKGIQQNYIQKNIAFSTNRFGDQNAAAYFNGDSYITCEDIYNTNQYKSFSISMWIKLIPGELGVFQGGYTDLFGRFGGIGTRKSSWGVIIDDNSRLGFAAHDGNQFSFSYIDEFLPQQEWFHVALIYVNKTVSFYINGNRIETKDCLEPQVSNNPFVVGARFNTPSFFKGYLDDILFIEGELTENDILELIEQ